MRKFSSLCIQHLTMVLQINSKITERGFPKACEGYRSLSTWIIIYNICKYIDCVVENILDHNRSFSTKRNASLFWTALM
jgi:hypothetical protein